MSDELRSQRLRVLVISPNAVKVAGNQSLFNLLTGYAQAGHEVHFLSIRKKDTRKLPYGLHPNITVHHYDWMPAWARPLWTTVRSLLFYPERLYRALRRANRGSKEGEAGLPEAQILIAEGGSLAVYLLSKLLWLAFQVYAFVVGSRLVKRYGINVIYGHEIWGSPVAYCLGRIFRVPTVSRFQGTHMGRLLNRPFARLLYLDQTLSYSLPHDLVVMTNDGTRGDEVLEALKVPSHKVRFWMNGVNKDLDVGDFDREAFLEGIGLTPSSKILLTVSNLGRWKRVDRAIRAMPAITNEQENARLVIVGDGAEKSNLVALAEKLGVTGYVLFMGTLPHNEVKVYMSAADLFLSLYDVSNRANSVYEAMVCGLCVITLDDGTVDDLIGNWRTGVLIKPESLVEDLPAAVLRLLADEALRRQIGQRAKKFAQERFLTWEERCALEVAAVQELVSGVTAQLLASGGDNSLRHTESAPSHRS